MKSIIWLGLGLVLTSTLVLGSSLWNACAWAQGRGMGRAGGTGYQLQQQATAGGAAVATTAGQTGSSTQNWGGPGMRRGAGQGWNRANCPYYGQRAQNPAASTPSAPTPANP